MNLSNYISRRWQDKQKQKLDIQLFISMTLGNFSIEILKLNLTQSHQLKGKLGPNFGFCFADIE